MPPPLPVMTEMHDGWGMASDHQEKLMTADQAAAVLSAPTRSGPGRRISVTCIRAPSCRTRNTGRRPTWPPGCVTPAARCMSRSMAPAWWSSFGRAT